MVKKLLSTTLLLAGVSTFASVEQVKYHIDINQHFKGVLLLENQKDATDAKYFNITNRDKIPFYAPHKRFSFTKLNGYPTLQTLEVSNLKKRIVYALSKLTEDELEEADISPTDVDSRAVIYNKEDLPTEVIEKREVHTIESLMLAIIEMHALPKKPFYLYEPHKKLLIKVEFTKEKSGVALDIANRTCNTKTYVLKISHRNKYLIRVYTNGYPLKVESYSKKWSFNLAGIGKPKTIILHNKDIVFKAFAQRIMDKYAPYNPKILSQDIENDQFAKKYTTTFKVSKSVDADALLDEYIQSYISHARSIKTSNAKDAFVLAVSNDEIQDYIEKNYKVEDDDYFWVETQKSITGSSIRKLAAKQNGCRLSPSTNAINCNGETQEVDYKETIEKKYKKDFKEFDIDDFELQKNDFDEVIRATFTLKFLKKMDKKFLQQMSLKAFMDKYADYNFPRNIRLQRVEDGWGIRISKQAVLNYACQKEIPVIKTKYSNGTCQTKAKDIQTLESVQEIVREYIQRNYPDLEILNEDVHYGDESVRFNYLNDLSKVTNECR